MVCLMPSIKSIVFFFSAPPAFIYFLSFFMLACWFSFSLGFLLSFMLSCLFSAFPSNFILFLSTFLSLSLVHLLAFFLFVFFLACLFPFFLNLFIACFLSLRSFLSLFHWFVLALFLSLPLFLPPSCLF